MAVRRLAPLSAAALHGVIRRQLGTSLPRHLLVRIADASGGNPLHALELARAVLLEGDLTPGRALPLSAGAGELLLKRVQALPRSTRDALLLLAAMGSTNIEELVRVGGNAAIEALDAAEEEALIVRSTTEVLLAHPLIAEAAYRAAGPPARRAAHVRLAEATSDAETRARHLGRGTLEPGPDVAAALDRGANAAVARGALAAAAELSEMACRLTPPEDITAQVERRLVLAQRVLDMGDSKRAAAEARDAIGLGPAGDARARARLVLANALRWTDGSDAAERELAEVEREPELSPLTLARVADLRGALARTESEAIEHYDTSIAYLRLADDPRFLAEQLLTRAEAAGWLGHGWDERVVEEARELERRAPARRVALNAETMQANALTWVDRLGEARLVYHAQLREAVARGEDASVMRLHMHLVRLELQAARWLDAEQHAVAYLELARDGDDPGEEALALVRLAAVDAMLGREADARARLARGLAVAADMTFDYGVAVGWATLGLLELSLGNSIPAAEALAAACELAGRRGIGDPGIFRNRGDLAEALVEAGRLDEAQTVADELLADAERLGRVRSVAAAKRAQALLGSARGDTAAAIAAAERSVELLADTELPFDHARSLLAAGRVHRRARHKGEAHRLLLGAVAALEGLRAPLWAALARTELARVGLRPAAPASLTETEAQVARLAARGLTNRQVADAAFLTPRSVEGVLRRIYNKLGISSRAQLGAAMVDEVDRARSR